MSEENGNPCRFKVVCRNCIKTAHADRPMMCEQIRCPEYRPCPRCGLNRTLHEFEGQNICKVCAGDNPELARQLIKNEQKKRASGSMSMPPVSSGNSDSTGHRTITITLPGVPPDGLEPAEIEHYKARWEDYKGYYRNPAAYFTCHMLILTEINMSFLNRKLIESRGEMSTETQRELQASIQMRKMLVDQLPSKEAEDMMDDDKALAVLYEAYIEEKKLARVGPVTRVFSAGAIALAPKLYFPVDPEKLLQKCGFRQVEIDEILPKIVDFHTDKTAEQILEFFGFKLEEKYAMPYETKTLEELDFSDGTDE